MAAIQPPSEYCAEITSVGTYLTHVSAWHAEHGITEERFLSGVWFRGSGRCHPNPLRPGVYRDDFTARAKVVPYGGTSLEQKRLELERRMIEDFRTSGAVFLNPNKVIDVYFVAQHYGMPTRLLDWTTNPLAGLFFAVENTEQHGDVGEVFVMEAKGILPPVDKATKSGEGLWNIVGMRHGYVVDAIGESFWHKPTKVRAPVIIPVRPDNQPGRIGQQSSCFTLHMHQSTARTNPTLAKMKIPPAAKPGLLKELHRLNISEFTIYNDLDHLSKDIKRSWEIARR